jgi:hypothetical protein
VENTGSENSSSTNNILLGVDVILLVRFKVIDQSPSNLTIGIQFQLVALSVGSHVEEPFLALVKVLRLREFPKNGSSARPLDVFLVIVLSLTSQRHALQLTIGVGLSKDTLNQLLADRVVKSIVGLGKELLGPAVESVPLAIAEKVRALDPLMLSRSAACPVRSHTTDDTSRSCGGKVAVRFLVWVLAIEDVGRVSGSFYFSIVPIMRVHYPTEEPRRPVP